MPTKVALLVPRLDSPQAIEIAKRGPAAMISRALSPPLLIEALERAFLATSATATASQIEVMARRTPSTDEQAIQAWLHGVPLTRREIEVTQLVAGRLRDREIAKQLCISEGTVKGHLHHIYEKLKVRGRGDLARYAWEHGWH